MLQNTDEKATENMARKQNSTQWQING